MIRRTSLKQFQDSFDAMYPELRSFVDNSGVQTITFLTTEDCTLRCKYCYEHTKDFKAYMTEDIAKTAVDCILDETKLGGYIKLKNNPAAIIEFMGGEPTCNIDVMHFIAEYFRWKALKLDHPWHKYYMFNFTTNGTTFFQPKVQDFFDKYGSRTSFTITLDGNKDLHDSCRIYPNGEGSFDDVLKAVKVAQDKYSMDSSKITLAPENLGYMNEAIRYFVSLGFTNIHANPVYEPVWTKEDGQRYYQELLKLADFIIENKLYEHTIIDLFDEQNGRPMSPCDNQNYCGGSGKMLSIDTKGYFYPCIRFMPFSVKGRAPYIIGNIWDGIDNVDTSKSIQDLRSITRRSTCKGDAEECWDCPVSTGCGECNGLVYELTGSPDGRLKGICWLHKARALANEYYWNRLYKIENEDKTYKCLLSDSDILYLKGGIK